MKDRKEDPGALRALAAMHDEECPTGQRLRARAEQAEKKSGPAQVATKQYRQGWESIFGAKQTVGQA